MTKTHKIEQDEENHASGTDITLCPCIPLAAAGTRRHEASGFLCTLQLPLATDLPRLMSVHDSTLQKRPQGLSASVSPEALAVDPPGFAGAVCAWASLCDFLIIKTCSRSSSVSCFALLRRRVLRRSVFRISLARAARSALALACSAFSALTLSLRVSSSRTSSTRFKALDAFAFPLAALLAFPVF